VAHRLAHQAHPAQHQEDAERRCRQGQRQAAGEGPAHEAEFDEGTDEEIREIGERHDTAP
jgi:hypothetical protein